MTNRPESGWWPQRAPPMVRRCVIAGPRMAENSGGRELTPVGTSPEPSRASTRPSLKSTMAATLTVWHSHRFQSSSPIVPRRRPRRRFVRTSPFHVPTQLLKTRQRHSRRRSAVVRQGLRRATTGRFPPAGSSAARAHRALPSTQPAWLGRLCGQTSTLVVLERLVRRVVPRRSRS